MSPTLPRTADATRRMIESNKAVLADLQISPGKIVDRYQNDRTSIEDLQAAGLVVGVRTHLRGLLEASQRLNEYLNLSIEQQTAHMAKLEALEAGSTPAH